MKDGLMTGCSTMYYQLGATRKRRQGAPQHFHVKCTLYFAWGAVAASELGCCGVLGIRPGMTRFLMLSHPVGLSASTGQIGAGRF